MKSKVKYIGISNRISINVIERSIHAYLLSGEINKEECLNHIKEYTKGENRANKTFGHLTAIIKRNDAILKKSKTLINSSEYFSLSIDDRKSFIICIFCLTFPIAYDILSAFATGFKVQTILNKQFLLDKIGSIYGGNRAMHIGVDEVIPLLIECNLIKREKRGIYIHDNKLNVTNRFIAELIIYTDIKLSGTKTILIEDIGYKPWFSYFNISLINVQELKSLVSKKDSAVGKGYLTV